MKRRVLLARTLMGTVSAGVFTAVGWLMGTQSLGTGWVYQDISTCPGGPSDCTCPSNSGTSCSCDTQCPPGGGTYLSQCRGSDYQYYSCCSNYPSQVCKLGTLLGSCGSCQGCSGCP